MYICVCHQCVIFFGCMAEYVADHQGLLSKGPTYFCILFFHAFPPQETNPQVHVRYVRPPHPGAPMMTPQPCGPCGPCGQPAHLRQSFMWPGGGWSWTQKQLWNAPEMSLWGQKLNCSYWWWKFEPFDSWSDFRSTTWMNRGCSCLNVLELLDIGPCISWVLMYLSMWFLMLAHETAISPQQGPPRMARWTPRWGPAIGILVGCSH